MKQITQSPSDSPYKLVNFGIDTLVLNVRFKASPDGVEFPAAVAQRLDLLQQEARDEEKLTVASLPPFGGDNLFMYPHGAGKGQWRWILECPSFKLYVGYGRLNGVVAQVRFASEYLWSGIDPDTHRQEIWPLVVDVETFLCDLLEQQAFDLQVSGLDMCADVAGWVVRNQDQDLFVSRARLRPGRNSFDAEKAGPDSFTCASSTLATLGFGSEHKAPLSAAVYDKWREIKEKSKKFWFYDRWKLFGWDGKSPVWRIEFRWKREALHEIKLEDVFHGIERIADLDVPGRLSFLWTYCTGHIQGSPDGLPDGWLRFVEESKDTNKSRWPIAPVWAVVQSAFCADLEPAVNITTGEVLELPISPMAVLIRKRHQETDVERLVLQVVGCLSGIAARLGGRKDDREVLEKLRASVDESEDLSYLDIKPDEVYEFAFALNWLQDHAIDYLMQKERKSIKDPFLLDKKFDFKYFNKVYDKRIKCGFQQITTFAKKTADEDAA